MSRTQRRVAVVGGGWAGLACAVQACADGAAVTLYEMAGHLGGRARSVMIDGSSYDNGQHILIGAYAETLRLMRLVGADPDRVLQRRPLELLYPDGRGLRMPAGPVHLAFAWAVMRVRGWTWRERIALLRQAGQWLRQGMRHPGAATVSDLCAALPPRVRDDLIDPLCVAALNTPASQADATVFLRVLADALFGPRGSSDLLLPAAGLSSLFPQPASAWLAARGAEIRLGQRVQGIARDHNSAWRVDAQSFDEVVLACSTVEAARLVAPIDATWSDIAAAVDHEPIATVYLRRGPRALSHPMMALLSAADRPAQFAFDLERLGQHERTVAFVVSGARDWLARGLPALTECVQRQAFEALPQSFAAPDAPCLHTALERRATFACTPALRRPNWSIAPGLSVAGDYVEGPYPATLEGAVRAGVRAARAGV